MSNRLFAKSRSLFLLSVLCVPICPAIYAQSQTWDGPYLGVYLGAGLGSNDATTNVGPAATSAYFTSPSDVNAVNNAGTSLNKPNAFIFGFQAGQDWAWKQMVYGAVLDYGSMSFNASHTSNNFSYVSSTDQYSIHTSVETDWLMTLRGRVGYSFVMHWPSLFYATGGMAMTQFKINDSFGDNAALLGRGNIQNSLYELGWVAGVGIDVAARKHLFLDLEYLYVGIPSESNTGSIANTANAFGVPVGSQQSPFVVNNEFHANLIRAGLSYHF